MAGTLIIRKMEFRDLDQVREIDEASFTLPWPKTSFQYELQHNSAARLWVAEQEAAAEQNLIVGMAVVWLILDEAHIATIAVRPEFRGRGIGQRILAELLQVSYKEGAKLAMLEVRASNLAAQRMYEKFGFEVVGRRPKYYKDNGEDALLMTCHSLLHEGLGEIFDRERSTNSLPAADNLEVKHAAEDQAKGSAWREVDGN